MAAVRAELRDVAESAYFIAWLATSVAWRELTPPMASDVAAPLMAKSAAELAAADKAVARRVKRFIEAYQAELVETVAAAQREGDIDSGVNPRDVAVLVLAVLRGMEALREGGASSATITTSGRTGHRAAPPRAPRKLTMPHGRDEFLYATDTTRWPSRPGRWPRPEPRTQLLTDWYIMGYCRSQSR